MNKKVLFHGNFSREDTISKFNEVSSRKIDLVIEEKARQIWKDKVQMAKESGKKIWDQPVYRLDGFEANDEKCVLEFSTIPFSIRTCIKDFTEELINKGEEYFPMATYSSIFIETSDGKFVFGEKSDKFVANRKYSFIGGVFNRSSSDIVPDLFASASKEVIEELGVDASDIGTVRLLGALRTGSCNVALAFYCKLKLTEDEIMENFKVRKDLEMESLFFGRREDMRDIVVTKIGKEAELVDIFEQSGNV